MPARRATLAVAALLLAASAGALACYEGPFAHANPNDPDARYVMRLEADRDTLSPAHPTVHLTLVLEPARPGYEPIWSVGIDTMVYHHANGTFYLTDIPEAVQAVQLTASFMNSSVSRTIWVAPTP